MKDTHVLSVEAAVSRFLEHLEGIGRSSKTIEKYRRALRTFSLLIGGEQSPESITKASIRKYKSYLAQHKTAGSHPRLLSVPTRNAHLSALRSFLRYCIQEEDLDVLPPDRVTRIKEQQRRPKWLRADELDRLLAMPDLQTINGKRDAAILELFFSTGLRINELSTLNRCDLNLDLRELAVIGKGGVARVTFLSDSAVAALHCYLASRLDHLDPLFITRHFKANTTLPPGEQHRISDRWIQKSVKKYALLAGIVSDPTPHVLRHTFATDLLRNGADLRSVQEMLGHKDIRTTQVYTHVTSPQLKKVHQRCHRTNPTS